MKFLGGGGGLFNWKTGWEWPDQTNITSDPRSRLYSCRKYLNLWYCLFQKSCPFLNIESIFIKSKCFRRWLSPRTRRRDISSNRSILPFDWREISSVNVFYYDIVHLHKKYLQIFVNNNKNWTLNYVLCTQFSDLEMKVVGLVSGGKVYIVIVPIPLYIPGLQLLANPMRAVSEI